MHIKDQDKDLTIFINHSSWQSEEKNSYVGPHQSPIDFTWINLTNSIVLKLWKLSSCLFKNKEKQKIIWKKPKWNQNCLKFEVLKIKCENWSFENYLKIEVLKIKIENWNFEKLFENGIFLRIKFEILNFEELYENGIS